MKKWIKHSFITAILLNIGQGILIRPIWKDTESFGYTTYNTIGFKYINFPPNILVTCILRGENGKNALCEDEAEVGLADPDNLDSTIHVIITGKGSKTL